jgi:hypothetical protein
MLFPGLLERTGAKNKFERNTCLSGTKLQGEKGAKLEKEIDKRG